MRSEAREEEGKDLGRERTNGGKGNQGGVGEGSVSREEENEGEGGRRKGE